MEINIMPGGIAERATTRAVSPIAACSVASGMVRPRVAPTFGTRSLAGVGSSAVRGMARGMWRGDLSTNLDITDPKTHSTFDQKFYDHKFTTRQGPPICSPPA